MDVEVSYSSAVDKMYVGLSSNNQSMGGILISAVSIAQCRALTGLVRHTLLYEYYV